MANTSNQNVLKDDLKEIYSNATQCLAEMNAFERAIHLFWLSGPFILLVERTPADIWLTSLGLIFVVKCLQTKNFVWLKTPWVVFSLLFWTSIILSTIFLKHKTLALIEALIWIRFPLFAFATVFWLAKDRRLLLAMLLCTGIGLLTMCGILTVELLLEGQKGNRLTWPYGDLVPGSYLAKVGLPAFLVLTAVTVSGRYRESLCFLAIILAILTIAFFTGERSNLLILICSGILAAFLSHKSKGALYLTLGTLAVLMTGLALTNLVYLRSIFNDLPLDPTSDYFNLFSTGIFIWENFPILGIGTGNYRHLCTDIIVLAKIEGFIPRCDNHPHNYYVQLLAETGVVGFILGSTLVMSILIKTLNFRHFNCASDLCKVSFVIPLALLFPITSTADFFGQWNNAFIWSAIALSLAMAPKVPKKSD